MRVVGMAHKEGIRGRLTRCIGKAKEERVALVALAEGQIADRYTLGTIEQNRVLAGRAHREGIGERKCLLRFCVIETDAHLDNIVKWAVDFGTRGNTSDERQQQKRKPGK